MSVRGQQSRGIFRSEEDGPGGGGASPIGAAVTSGGIDVQRCHSRPVATADTTFA
jgi:hypothetical protein